ncbi:MAG: carboxypeptidase-like regulatory domain-containing protein [Candidatus Paceibacterota bacterium]
MFFCVPLAFASETEGVIDSTYKYAWGENIGWLNFACDNCNVKITDDSLSGYAWSTQFGWINLNPSTSGVKNNGEGVLSGYAWSSNLGWIDFTGVSINTAGDFSGYATIKSDSSRINFNCSNGSSCASADFKVKTDWKPARLRPHGKVGPISTPSAPPVLPPVVTTPIVNVVENIKDIVGSISDTIVNIFKPEKKPIEEIIIEVPKLAPLSFKSKWDLLPVKAINSFVFAPLPYEVRILAGKFPELAQTLKSVGIERLTDMDKLSGVTFNIKGLSELEKILQTVEIEKLTDVNKIQGVALDVPGLPDMNQQMINSFGTGKIALIQGLPVAKFPLIAKQNLPTEFVFARASGELVDLNVALSVGEKGEVTQQIASLPGKTLRLVVKPISKARSVTGYFVFKASTPKISENIISRATLTASALFSMAGLVEKTAEPVSVENKLVLSSFEYTDPDKDGIYTADVIAPTVPGEYEVITVIDYVDPVLGTRQMRMITVIDPEGYVFEKNNGKETRIPSAIVSLYTLNTSTKQYELWNAKDYQQENPQITDIRGTYSFLVPEGSYYFTVEAPSYNSYEGKVFVVTEGSGIHQNIELESGRGFFSAFDWKTALLVVVFLLLMYNFYRNTLRGKLLKFLTKHDGQ